LLLLTNSTQQLDLLFQNQQHIKNLVTKLNIQTNTKVIELTKAAEVRHNNLLTDLLVKFNLTRKEIGEMKNLLVSYKEEVQDKNTVESIEFINTTVETDNFLQQLLAEGFTKYQKENYSEALKLYKQILEIDDSNTEALCYYNASLYYQNPGDGSIFSEIKNDLIPLLEAKVLSKEEELTALNILIGIGLEEGQ
jgi:tetratricopeptide (TPR) repeat protein